MLHKGNSEKSGMQVYFKLEKKKKKEGENENETELYSLPCW